MSLAAVFTWVTVPENVLASHVIRNYVLMNNLNTDLTSEETEIMNLDRNEANTRHGHVIGWKLENMVMLSWSLGFNFEPTIDATQISAQIQRNMLVDFLGMLNPNLVASNIIKKIIIRPDHEIIAAEDLFYCAFNGIRNAQDGICSAGDCYDFDSHARIIQERFHALNWVLSPGITWTDTDLST